MYSVLNYSIFITLFKYFRIQYQRGRNGRQEMRVRAAEYQGQFVDLIQSKYRKY